MANPSGSPKGCTDNDVWDLPFSIKLGAAGVVAASSLPRDIKSIARTGNAGEYLALMRERWGDPKNANFPGAVVGFQAQGLTTVVNRGQATVDNTNGTTPSFTFVTLAESAGVQAPTDLANGVVISGTVSLRNSSVK